MKLHIVLTIALLIGAGCERKKPRSDADTGSQAAGVPDAAAPSALKSKPYYYTSHVDEQGRPKFTNVLAKSANPWLSRHGHQPVKWMGWDDKPFVLAKPKNMPVLMMVGEIDCSPCVKKGSMFDDPALAKVVNERFVPVLIDAADRADIAAFVTESVAATSGKVTPALVVVMTPDGHVAWDASGPADASSLATQLTAWADEFATKRGAVDQAAKDTTGRVRKRQLDLAGQAPKDREMLERALSSLHESFDGEHAGWPSDGLKTPQPERIRFLLRASRWAEDKDATLALATQTLDKMAEALADERGFFTSTADAQWKLEYKVKSLDTNAALLLAYTDAWQLTKAERYEKTAHSIAAFIVEDLALPKGGFRAHAIVRPDGTTVFDERLLTAANGAAIAALAHAAWVFGQETWIASAVKAVNELPVTKNRLVHSSVNSVHSPTGYASDFANVIDGLLNVFHITADPVYLRRAVLVQNQLQVGMWDEQAKGYFHVGPSLASDLPVRMKLVRGNTANATGVTNLLRLETYLMDETQRQRRKQLLGATSEAYHADLLASPTFLIGLDWLQGDMKRVVVSGKEPEALMNVLRTTFLPHTVFAAVVEGSPVPWAAGKELKGGESAGWVCRADCGEPIREPAEFQKALQP